jgi:hypothetical protein
MLSTASYPPWGLMVGVTSSLVVIARDSEYIERSSSITHVLFLAFGAKRGSKLLPFFDKTFDIVSQFGFSSAFLPNDGIKSPL